MSVKLETYLLARNYGLAHKLLVELGTYRKIHWRLFVAAAVPARNDLLHIGRFCCPPMQIVFHCLEIGLHGEYYDLPAMNNA